MTPVRPLDNTVSRGEGRRRAELLPSKVLLLTLSSARSPRFRIFTAARFSDVEKF